MKVLESVRVDKWLWSVRLYKNRSEATSACNRNEVKVEDQVAKASRNVKVGMKVSAKIKGFHRVFTIVELAQKPVGNDRGHLYYEDLTNPETLETIQDELAFKRAESQGRVFRPVKTELKVQKTAQKYIKDKKGRPTKKQRRDMDDLWGN